MYMSYHVLFYHFVVSYSIHDIQRVCVAAFGIELHRISELPCPETEPFMYRTWHQLMISERGWTMATEYVLASSRTGPEKTCDECLRVSNASAFAHVSNLSS